MGSIAMTKLPEPRKRSKTITKRPSSERHGSHRRRFTSDTPILQPHHASTALQQQPKVAQKWYRPRSTNAGHILRPVPSVAHCSSSTLIRREQHFACLYSKASRRSNKKICSKQFGKARASWCYKTASTVPTCRLLFSQVCNAWAGSLY